MPATTKSIETDQHDSAASPERGARLHLNLAFRGQQAALDGDHLTALEHYRQAVRLAVSSQAPEVFFRYYTQCVLESLEHLGSFHEIIEFCQRADEQHRTIDSPLPLHKADHGAVLERLGVAQLKNGSCDEAAESLARARAISPRPLPIAAQLLDWMARRYTITLERIAEIQERHDYFVVRPGSTPSNPFDSMTESSEQNS